MARTGLSMSLLASLTAAQSVLVVDPRNPATYATLGDAVAAAVDGDVIVIRDNGALWYDQAPLTITKSLRILGDDVRLVGGPLTIAPPAGKEVTMSGCSFGYTLFVNFPSPLRLRIENCAGRVSILDAAYPAGAAEITIQNAGQVLFADIAWITMTRSMAITNSNVAFDRCVLAGANAVPGHGIWAQRALDATASTVRAMSSGFLGGAGAAGSYYTGAGAMTLTDVRLTIAGPAGGVAAGQGATESAILATNCVITHEPTLWTTMELIASTVIVRPLPSVTALAMPSWPISTLIANSGPGSVTALLVGLPADRTAIGSGADLWLDQAHSCTALFGIQNGALRWNVALPPAASLFATQFRWQSATLTSAGVELSAPGATLFR